VINPSLYKKPDVKTDGKDSVWIHQYHSVDLFRKSVTGMDTSKWRNAEAFTPWLCPAPRPNISNSKLKDTITGRRPVRPRRPPVLFITTRDGLDGYIARLKSAKARDSQQMRCPTFGSPAVHINQKKLEYDESFCEEERKKTEDKRRSPTSLFGKKEWICARQNSLITKNL
jgi:hypothetical protein